MLADDGYEVTLPLPWGHCEHRECDAIGVLYLDAEHEGVWCNVHRWVRCPYTRNGSKWACGQPTHHDPYCEQHMRARR
jgi:hypothetical protein